MKRGNSSTHKKGNQMPRGVYDRSKAKPRGAAKAEKAAATPAAEAAPVQKRKYTRRAVASPTVDELAKPATLAMMSSRPGDLFRLAELVNIRTQFATGGAAGGGSVLTKLDNLIGAEADSLLPKAEAIVEKVAAVAEKPAEVPHKEPKTVKNGKHAAPPAPAGPVDPASLPGFNPPPPPPVQQ